MSECRGLFEEPLPIYFNYILHMKINEKYTNTMLYKVSLNGKTLLYHRMCR